MLFLEGADLLGLGRRWTGENEQSAGITFMPKTGGQINILRSHPEV